MSIWECVWHNNNDTHSLCLCISFLQFLGLDLHKGLCLVSAIDFDVDLGIILFFFPLLVEVFAETQQVDGQQETKHAEGEETHIHLKQIGDRE